MKSLILLVSLLISVQVLAKGEKKVMTDVGRSFVKLIPYMSSEKNFSDVNNKKEIQERLSLILSAFKKSGHVDKFKQSEFKAPYEIMVDHLDKTIESFDSNHTIFAYKKLRATGQLCMSCHSMVKGSSKGFVREIAKVKRKDFSNHFDYAEFLFITKQYTKASRYYNKWAEEVLSKVNGSNAIADNLIRKTIIKNLTIHLAINFNPRKAKMFLEKILSNKNITPSMKSFLKEAIKDLDPWLTWKRSKAITKEVLNKFILKHLLPLESDNEVIVESSSFPTLLISKGIMDKYLQKSKRDSSVAKAMYWKAVAERSVGFSFFYSLSDSLLKTCIKDFPKTSIARKCYDEFEKEVVFGFSGSAGTNIPKEIKKELEDLKSLILQN